MPDHPHTVPPSVAASQGPSKTPDAIRRGRIKMLAILAVCASPVIASYTMYYVVKPEGRSNYGELIEPQRPVGDLGGRTGDGRPFTLSGLRGKWIFVTAQAGPCDEDCIARLYAMRQVRTATGKERDRIERVVLLTGGATLPPPLAAEHPGLIAVQAQADAVAGALGPDVPAGAGSGQVYVIDPLGNLMMRFPRQANPSRMKKDIDKLLRASRVG